ncbi:uncharacterized protein MCYG_04149 [Microsporum canis CBS 113480]|uniref:Uncharacterized protein n=1 Tax=Arthroderma otae (strain ATCC MYA-4605 / CBS 113480) TaxID=554155 RepID=C5FN94_ARTOC|nr:uncharacterized protein MCYG_04149 [Microsporum canis CBS 113480]EEQ31330.1 predicted protein [Microsporum canis CBS 113480]
MALSLITTYFIDIDIDVGTCLKTSRWSRIQPPTKMGNVISASAGVTDWLMISSGGQEQQASLASRLYALFCLIFRGPDVHKTFFDVIRKAGRANISKSQLLEYGLRPPGCTHEEQSTCPCLQVPCGLQTT